MKTFSLLSIALACASTLAHPAENALVPGKTLAPRRMTVEKRQGTGTSIFVNLLSALFKNVFPSPPACASEFLEGDDYWIMTGQAENGLYWSACWMNDTETVLFGQPEVDVTNCLTNLHYTQADTCISTEGSMCDNGYVAGGGRLQNLREPIIGSGYQSGAQISADASSALQAAVWAINGQMVRGLDAKGPYFLINTDSSFTTLSNAAEQMQVNWIGETAC